MHAAKGTIGALKVSQHVSRQAKSESGSTTVGTGARSNEDCTWRTYTDTRYFFRKCILITCKYSLDISVIRQVASINDKTS